MSIILRTKACTKRLCSVRQRMEQKLLSHLTKPTRYPRSAYKEVWNNLATDFSGAMLSVMGAADEEKFRISGRSSALLLSQLLAIKPTDTVLEIGCGVGRIGRELAPQCLHWIGCDISSQMLHHAKHFLKEYKNIDLVELSRSDLSPIPSNSVDVVYCSVVFMHLDEWDRFSYIKEAFRVLRPGGRCYVDNLNLSGSDTWKIFLQLAALSPTDRPSNISQCSTSEELRVYFERSGFTAIKVTPGDHFVTAVGRKP